MAVKVGINGFGRIGKCVVRAAINNPDVEVVAINATGDNEGTALLLKYDSVHGTIPNEVTTRVTKAITKVIRAIKATKVIRVIIKETTKVSLVIHN